MRSIRGNAEMAAAPLLALDGLRVAFDTERGTLEAVRGVALDVPRGECLAVVGESGSGKSQLFLACLGLLPANGRASGSACLDSDELIGRPEAHLERIRGARVGLVSQDPMNALTPHLRIGTQLVEHVTDRGRMSGPQARARALELLGAVGIDDAAARFDQYPHELSGGQRQRVAIAMALMPGPELLVADEPTTALDVTVQAQVLQVLRRLREQGLTIVLITHDLGVVAGVADRVAVMYAGTVVEQARTTELFGSPRHPYTRGLLDSVPRLDAPSDRLSGIEGQPPGPHEHITGCAFAPRCRQARDRCRSEEPAPQAAGDAVWACHAPLPRGWAA